MSVSQKSIKLSYAIRVVPRYGYGAPPHPLLYEIMNRTRAAYKETLRSLLTFNRHFLKISTTQPADPREPYWVNGWLPGLDAVALYGLLSLKRPKRYLEIGSGHSTKFAHRAILDHRLPTQITSIDPHPRAEIDSFCHRTVRKPLEETDLTVFDELEAGDVVFIDGSHHCFMNSDVTVFFLDILPQLRPGTLVQVHDVFLPYDYPPEWIEKYYSEQYLLAVYLLAKRDDLKIVLPNAFVSVDSELSQVLEPIWNDPKMEGIERHGGSFWFET